MKAATKTNLKLASLVLGMFCFGFALVPIYDVFCEITGLNGKVSGPTITAVSYTHLTLPTIYSV